MDPMTMAMLAGTAANVAGGIIGGNAAKKAADKAAKQQKEMYERNIAILEAVGIPSVEAQKIALENPEYVGDLVNEVMGPSAMEEISLDPQLRQNQMDVLAELQDLSQTGMGIQDRVALDEALQAAAGQDQSRQRAIESQMAQQGLSDSGVNLAARLNSAQQANQMANQNARALAGQSQNARMAALNSLASQSGQLEQLDWGRGAQKASAADAIQQSNVALRNQANQFNLQNKQALENQRAANTNTQEIQNKGLLQQDYQNRLNQAKAKIGMNADFGATQAQNTLTSGQGEANMWAGLGSGLGQLGTAYAGHERDKELAKIKKG